MRFVERRKERELIDKRNHSRRPTTYARTSINCGECV